MWSLDGLMTTLFLSWKTLSQQGGLPAKRPTGGFEPAIGFVALR
jgi:hypothetical protein